MHYRIDGIDRFTSENSSFTAIFCNYLATKISEKPYGLFDTEVSSVRLFRNETYDNELTIIGCNKLWIKVFHMVVE